MTMADKSGGMMAPLAHRPGVKDPHRPQQPPLRSLSAANHSPGSEKAAATCLVVEGKRAQVLIIAKAIGHIDSFAIRWVQPLYVMRT